jgi:biopolymer transport protein ExbD
VTIPAQPPVDEIQRMRFRQALARKKRKEREQAGEIRELNIVAMMDMMTIILVFLLKSYSATAVAMMASEDIRPPVSTTRTTPRDTVAVTVTPRAILVGDKKVVTLESGALPTPLMEGRLIRPLSEALGKEVQKLKFIADKNPTATFNHELSVIGDKSISYDLLLSVLYTAGQNELENFRFVVMQKD